MGASVGAAGGWVMGGGHSAFSPKFGLGTAIPVHCSTSIHKMTIQVSITFFNLLSSLLMNLLSPPTPSNTQTCFGRYAVAVEVPTASLLQLLTKPIRSSP